MKDPLPTIRKIVGRGRELLSGPVVESEQGSTGMGVPAPSVAGSIDEFVFPGGPRSTRVEIRGWALLGDRPASAVLVSANGRVVGALPTGRPRADVVEAFGAEEARASGFAGIVDLAPALRGGGLSVANVQLEALDESSVSHGLVATAEVAVGLAPTDEGFAGGIDASTLLSPVRRPRFTVSGWAAFDGCPVAIVTLWAGGVPIGVARTGIARPDVVELTGNAELAAVGFACAVDLMPALAAGVELEIQATAADADGTVRGWLDPVPLTYVGPRDVLAPIGQIDHWKQGDRVARDLLRVYGWAALPGATAVGVVLWVNGERAAVVPLDIARPELEELLGAGVADEAGFDATIDLSDLDADEAAIAVTVVPADPASLVLDPDVVVVSSVTLRLPKRSEETSASGVRGALDVPLDRGVERGVVNLWGWALGKDFPLDRVEIFVEGVSRGIARFGLDRMDIADRYGVPHAGACGFEHLVDFSSIPDDVRRVRISVVAHFVTGATAEIAWRTARLLDRPKPPSKRREERSETLRARTAALVSALPAPRTDDLNLLAITHHLGYGGAQLWLSELLARSGAGRKYACTVLAPQDGALRSDLERMGVAVHVTNDFPMQSAELYEARVAELSVLARAQGWNGVLVNTALCSMGADVAMRLGLPCVWAIHESWPPAEFWAVAYPPQHIDPIVLRRANELFGNVDALVFEAEATRQQYLGHAAAERAHVVHYGIDVRAVDRYLEKVSREQARASLGFDEEDFVVLVVGTIEPRKAQTIIAEAFATVCSAHPRARLVFVGGADTPYTKALRHYVDGVELEDRIEIQPIVKDTYLRYRAADLFMSASDVESLPRSVLEVMYFGVPVLATEVFGLPELIEHGKTGFLFAPKSLVAATDALERTLSLDVTELRHVGEAGRRLVGSSYDSRSYSRTIIDLLTSMVIPAPSRPVA